MDTCKTLALFLLSTISIAYGTPISEDCGYCGKHAPRTPSVSPPVSTPPVTVPTIPVPPVTIPKLPVPLPPVTVPKVPIPPVSGLPVPLPPVTVPEVPIPPVSGLPVPIPPVAVPNLPLPPVTGTPTGKSCPPPSSSSATCPIDTLKLGACVDILGGLLPIKVGDPAVSKCCPVISGLVGAEAAVCLCTTLKLKALNLNIYLPVALELLVSCGKTAPSGFTCPH